MAWNSRRTRPLSADCTPRTTSPSILLSMLPSVVQSRLPNLSSLRRYSNSTDGGQSGSRRTSVSAPGSGCRTPIAGIDNAMVLSSIGLEESLYITEPMSDDGATTPPIEQKKRQLAADETNGIGWKFANQGLNLLSLAVDESLSTSPEPRFGKGGFARQLYIHSLTYLLRGLPSDMTLDEQSSLRSALPVEIAEPMHFQHATDKFIPTIGAEPSLLHRTLASTIVQLFILFQFLLPYFKFILNAAYQYDREHKVSEKVLSQSIETLDVVGKRGVGLASVVFSMGDGKVGQLFTDTASWVVEGVTGGIHEGVGKGMVIMGARKPTMHVGRR